MKLSISLFRSFLSISLALSIISISLNTFSNELVIDEVIVTAEKRVESLQDVSKAVTALSSDEIERKKYSRFCWS
jgi:iron complex outermembrane receptor protein